MTEFEIWSDYSPPDLEPSADRRVVYQTIHVLPGANCVQAATATILGYRLSQVPNFMLAEGHPGWYRAWWQWLESEGFQILHYASPTWAPRGLYIAMGPAGHADGDHAVVMCKGKLFHDPAGPSARGLDRIDSIYVLLPLDPGAKR